MMNCLNYLNSFPPGWRFCPNDKELVSYYLRNKVLNKPLPPNKILDINLYSQGPQDLSGIYRTIMCSEERDKIMYFFTPRDRKYPKGSRPSRAAGFGYWKATGVDNIIGPKTNPIGYRKSLVYYQGTSKSSTKTNWIMHEYRIDLKSPLRSPRAAPNDMKLDDWVLCKVYLKEKKSNENEQRDIASTETDEANNIIFHSGSVASPLMQSNYNFNFDSTSFDPPLQINNNVPNNFGSASSAAPPMEANNNSNIMQDPQLYGFDYSTSEFLEEGVDDGLLPIIEYKPPPTFDDEDFNCL